MYKSQDFAEIILRERTFTFTSADKFLCSAVLLMCLQLFLKRPQDCEFAGVLIERVARISSLTIEIGHIFHRKLRHSLHVSQRMKTIEALFGSIDDNTPRLGLKSLRLKAFPLQELTEILPTKLPLQGLKHLQLIRCPKERIFVRRLIQLLVDLATYYLDADNARMSEDPNEHESLLELMTAPKRVEITSITPLLHNWSRLSACSHALRILKIGDEIYDTEYVYPVFHRSMTHFFDFCGAASSLEQLAITCPPHEASSWGEVDGFAKMW